MNTRRQAPDWVIAIVLLAALAILIIPLPPVVLDALFALNLAAAITLVAAVATLDRPLRFSSFPTLLVAGTLIRVALGVAATRAILSHGDAGRVVHGFGSAIATSALVGLVLFTIIVVIQLVVITRGAERVAEVAARFALDALPGRQAALEADAKAGALSRAAAGTARAELQHESQLYGAMDGAMKFVKGDAIASIIIVLINLVAGLAIGMTQRGLSFAEAGGTIVILSVGEGLLSAIPSLCVAVAAGIWITRAAHGGRVTVSRDVWDSLLATPTALSLAAALVFALALAPGLPAWPFIIIAGALAFGAWYRYRHAAPATTAAVALVVAPEIAAHLTSRDAATLQSDLAPLLGNETPQLVWRADPNQPVTRLTVVGTTTLAWGQLAGNDRESILAGAATALRLAAPMFISIDVVGRALQVVATREPALVRETVPARAAVAHVTELARQLVADGLPFDVPALLAAIAHAAASPPQLDDVRSALRQSISARFAQSGDLDVLAVDPALEDTLRDARQVRGGSDVLALSPAVAHELIDAVRAHAGTKPAVVLASADVRGMLQGLLRDDLPLVAVLAAHELAPGIAVRARATIELD